MWTVPIFSMMKISILFISAYLIGSIPSGFLLVKLKRGVDVREYGSRNVGAINVFRVGGTSLGILTLVADIIKAVLVVLLASLISSAQWVTAVSAMLVLLGHAFSFWFYLYERRFSEGKCVASSLGVLVGLAIVKDVAWWVPVLPPCIWICGLLVPRYITGQWGRISPITMITAALIPVIVLLSRPDAVFIWLSVGMALIILIRHKNNIKRLLAGTEPRLGERG